MLGEALAAAEAAYLAYISEVDAILRLESPVEGIKDFTNTSYGDQRTGELSAFLSSQLRSTGSTLVDSISLAEYSQRGTPETISIYTCTDVSGTRLYNAAGEDVTPPDRDTRVPVMISLEAHSSGRVLVSGDQLWTGENFC